jgi:hypothetical protein
MIEERISNAQFPAITHNYAMQLYSTPQKFTFKANSPPFHRSLIGILNTTPALFPSSMLR